MTQGTTVTWDDRRALRPSTYVWKGRLLTCGRWVLRSADHALACEIERNAKGSTVDFYRRGSDDGHGTVLTFSTLGSYDLCYRRIYVGPMDACADDVLAWVNDRRAPCSGVDGGILLSLDEWGNEVAV